MTYDEGRKTLLFMWKAGHPESDQVNSWLDGEALPLLRNMSPAVRDILPWHCYGFIKGDKEDSEAEEDMGGISRYVLPLLVHIVDQIDPSTAPDELWLGSMLRHEAAINLLEGDNHD